MFKTEKRGEVMVVVAVEELDARNAQRAKQFFNDLVAAGEKRMVVDLSPVNFIDSSGLGALLTALREARRVDGDVKLCGMRAPVKTIFELTRMYRIFDVFTEADEAVRSFG